MNAGVMYEKAKRPEDAADIYLDVATNYGDKTPDLAEKAAFTAGVGLRTGDLLRLCREGLRDRDRQVRQGHARRRRALQRRPAPPGARPERQGDRALQGIHEAVLEPQDAPDVAFNIGLVYEDSARKVRRIKRSPTTRGIYTSTNKRLMEAHTRAGKLQYDLGQFRKAKEEFDKTLALYKRANGAAKADGKSWAAEARYYQGELIFRDYEKVSIDVPPRQLTSALTKKTKLLAEAEKVYFSIADFNDLKWATAALYRDGQIYDLFADALTAAGAKRPAGLPADQCQMYQDAINEKVVSIQDIAVQRFTVGYQKAIQTQNYDEYTAKIRAALGKLAADKFPPEHEARAEKRTGDRPPTPDLITEIAR